MSYSNPRIQLTDTLFDVIYNMSGGNPGAVTALMTLYQDGPSIDPDDMFGGLGIILGFDTADIYDSDIYVLWNDVCGRQSKLTHAVMRACQLGMIEDADIHRMIRTGDSTQVHDLLAQVQQRLPRFAQ